MNRILTAVLLVVPALAFTACSSSVGGGLGYTKDQARALGGVDAQGNDICAAEGWYDDGTCDDFCTKADGDCAPSNQCPNEDDPSVHYVGGPGACTAAFWACDANQTPFDSPDCGCGCIDMNPGKTCGGFAGIACGAGEFCNYGPGAGCGFADQTGTCAPLPDACPEYYGPVCGCDGVTYGNPCFANAAGVSVASDGECGSSGTFCGGIAGIPCAAGEFCNYGPDAMCGNADQGGTCAPIPEGCTKEYAPVCGCDGNTYSNACMAHAAGVSVASDGACGGSGAFCGGFAGFTCPAGEFCDYAPETMCGSGDQGGTCAPIPQACDLNYDPVCGCDGVTYGNACGANAAGVSVAAKGECAK